MRACLPALLLALLGASAGAGTTPASELKALEGRIAIETAQALADKQLFGRARDILTRLAKSHRELAAEAARRMEAIDGRAQRATDPRLPAGGSAPALQRANGLMDGGQCSEALVLLQRMVQGSTPAAREARDGIAVIESVAQGVLREGVDLAGVGRYPHAAIPLAVVQFRFAGTKAAKGLRAAIDERVTDAAGRRALDGLIARLEPLVAPEPDKPDIPAEPTTPSADEVRARRLVQLARNYVANDLHARALPLLQRVLKDYPNTSAAAEAQALLAQIK